MHKKNERASKWESLGGQAMCPCMYHAAHKAFLPPAHNIGREMAVEVSVNKDSALGNVKIFESISCTP